MWLVWSDLSLQHRSSLGMVPLAALLMAVLAFVMGVAEAAAFPIVLVTMMAWGASLRAAYEDDKADTWLFVRALPIPPARVVASRYLSGLVVTLAFGLAVAVPLAFLNRGTWPVTVPVATGAGIVLTGLFNAVYYRFGYRTVSTWFRYVLLLVALGGMVLARLLLPHAGRSLARAAGWMGANPSAVPFLAMALVAAVYLATWIYATAVFAGKELA